MDSHFALQIILLEVINDEWYRGSIAEKVGMFPKDFVKVLELTEPSSSNESSKDSLKNTGPRAIATLIYSSTNRSDLCLAVGDEIELLERVGMFYEGIAKGVRGLFPKAAVRIICDLPQFFYL